MKLPSKLIVVHGIRRPSCEGGCEAIHIGLSWRLEPCWYTLKDLQVRFHSQIMSGAVGFTQSVVQRIVAVDE